MKTILSAIIIFSSVTLMSCSQNTSKEESVKKESDVKTTCICENCDGNCEKNGCSANCGHK